MFSPILIVQLIVNMEVYFALMHSGDTFMGMKLDQGGHLSCYHPGQ